MKKEEIIRVTLELGAERGEGGVTMRSIASRLGVNVNVLYNHFDRKEQIFDAIRLNALELLKSEVLDPATAIEDLRERIFVVLCNYFSFARNRPWLFSVSMGRLDPKAHPLLGTIRDWLFEGSERGFWRTNLDVRMASLQIYLPMHGLCMMVPREDEQAFVETLIRSMIDGLEPSVPFH